MTTDILFLFLLFPYFLFAVFLAFFVPGNLLIKRLNLPVLSKVILSICVGMVFWAFQGFILGYLELRYLSYVYIILCLILWIWKNRSTYHTRIQPHALNINILLLGTILAGISVQVFPVLFMGMKDAQFLKFCCGATEDFMYHMDLTRQVIRHIPPEEPGLASIPISNYHYWGNIVIGELIRVFRLPFVFTHFQYFGLLISSLLGLTAISFCQINKLKKLTAWLLVFFLYFSGDFIYILSFITRGIFDVGAGALESGPIFLYNPPRAFSIVILFSGLSLFSIWIKKKNMYSGILMAIVFASTIGFKANTGIFALTGLTAVFLYFLFHRRITMLFPILLSAVISLIIYLSTNKNSGGLYYSGFWRFNDFATNPHMGLATLELRRITYASQNNWLKVLLYDIFFMILYTISTFGSKLVGLFQTRKSLSSLGLETNIFLIVGVLTSTLAGYFFLQTSGEANSFNFIVTVYIISSIYGALALSYWFSKMPRYFSLSVVALLIIVNLPRAITETQKTITMVQNPGGISNVDVDAMLYIRDHLEKNAIILTRQPFYIFIAERSSFFGNTGVLRSHNIDYAKRAEIVNEIFSEQDNEIVKNLLKRNNIQYLYLAINEKLPGKDPTKLFVSVYTNKGVKIVKVI